jgi:hypothetical protein
LDEGELVVFKGCDPNAVAGLLKTFFRDLPDPLIPEDISDAISPILGNITS